MASYCRRCKTKAHEKCELPLHRFRGKVARCCCGRELRTEDVDVRPEA